MFGFKTTYPEGWKTIESENDLDEIIQRSHDKPQLIFKHSPSCGVSFFAKKDLESLNNDIFEKLDFHVVNVIKQRPLSQYIALELSTRHESPQILFIENEEVKWNGSHSQVKASAVEQLVNNQ